MIAASASGVGVRHQLVLQQDRKRFFGFDLAIHRVAHEAESIRIFEFFCQHLQHPESCDLAVLYAQKNSGQEQGEDFGGRFAFLGRFSFQQEARDDLVVGAAWLETLLREQLFTVAQFLGGLLKVTFQPHREPLVLHRAGEVRQLTAHRPNRGIVLDEQRSENLVQCRILHDPSASCFGVSSVVSHYETTARSGSHDPISMNGEKSLTLRDRFHIFSRCISDAVGSVWAFLLALSVVAVWGLTGPLFAFSDTWQLVINTGTTIVTFIMVFLIQSTQNRDSKAVHLKLDELIRAVQGARNDLVDLEDLPEEELEALAAQFARMRKELCEEVKERHLEE